MSAPALSAEREANLAENPFAGQGPVLLDIGGDVGAVVLLLPSSMHGAEIGIVPVAGHRHPDHGHVHVHDGKAHVHHRHVAVVERPVEGGSVFAAVFPDVHAGTYDLRERGGPATVRVVVHGGSVTEALWA